MKKQNGRLGGLVGIGLLAVMFGGAGRAAEADLRVRDQVDHARILRNLGSDAFELGQRIYQNLCVNCHGSDGKTPSLPIARAFGVGPFKFGSDPYSLYQTLSEGNGLMGAQSWMTPEERYAVIHYIREAFMKPQYPGFQPIDDGYLARFESVDPQEATEASEGSGQRDFGGALASQLRVKDGEHERDYPSVLTLRLSPTLTIAYDLHRMQQAGLWRGGFLDLSQTQHQRPRGEFIPLIEGELLAGLQRYGWLYDDSETDSSSPLAPAVLVSPRGPLPRELMHYQGYHVADDRTVLSYQVRGRSIWELPAAMVDQTGVIHNFHVESGDEAVRLVVGQTTEQAGVVRGVMPWDELRPVSTKGSGHGTIAVLFEGQLNAGSDRQTPWVAANVLGDDGLSWRVDAKNRLVLTIPASQESIQFQLSRSAGFGAATLYAFAGAMQLQALRGDALIDPHTFRGGAESRWPEVIETSVERSAEQAAYVKDEIALPEPNPWNAWMRTAALDFFENGTMAVSTHGGDVWLVTNLSGAKARWKRFAAGLYEPFGLKVVDDTIYVTCKDRLVRLHDRNGDDEADFYESFYADWDVSMFFHAFNFDLQRDVAGNLYYAKSGQYTDFRLPGAVIKVAQDGTSSEVVATGFRTPNGLGILPDGRVTLGDNQGNWIPASKVSLIRSGGFYGYVNNLERKGRWAPDGGRLALDRVPVPSQFEQPIIWMPQEIDSSCGGQVWVDDERWGPLAGRLIHTSFGKARVFYLMLQEFDDVVQGALVRLPFQFQAGIQRARVNPADGQLYLVGLHGWNGGWPKELGPMQHGGVYRLRYTGRPLVMVSDVQVEAGAIWVQMNAEVDRDRLPAEGEFNVQAWNYRWSQRYGSDQYSILDPERRGRDELLVERVGLDASGTRLRLEIPELRPCHQVKLDLAVPVLSAGRFAEEILLTVNGIPDDSR